MGIDPLSRASTHPTGTEQGRPFLVCLEQPHPVIRAIAMRLLILMAPTTIGRGPVALWGERTFPATRPVPSPRMWGGLGWGRVRTSGALSTKPLPLPRHPGICESKCPGPRKPSKTKPSLGPGLDLRPNQEDGPGDFPKNLSTRVPSPHKLHASSPQEPRRYRSVCGRVAPEDGECGSLRPMLL